MTCTIELVFSVLPFLSAVRLRELSSSSSSVPPVVLALPFPANTASFRCTFRSCSSRRSFLSLSLAACDAF
ncbi:hypothetical protein BJY52DRAFT_1238712 [Lactarius psammicola]|nr:hypothetical protein BJY52DRAFT_1238712 [Lactarius psammicola]